MKLNQETDRVLARCGARELTPEEIARVSGGISALSATTQVVTAIFKGHVDTPETDDL
jgi:hypothetical protein